MKKRKEERQKKKINWKQWIGMAFGLLIGAGCGFAIAHYADSSAGSDTTPGRTVFTFVFLLAAMYICFLVHVVIHEAGHLVFGLLSGYEFTSFRIGSFMWIKENGKIKTKRFSLAGTGGQCLMSPPDFEDGKFPVFWYNMGGSFMNLIASLLCGIIWFLIGRVNIVSVILMMMVLIGIASAVMNGVPMRLAAVDNDGYNAFSLRKDPQAVYAFWLQMKVNGQISKGFRLKDMPDEWFEAPSDEEMKNSMVAVQGVFVCNRLMDEQRFEEADRLMEHYLSIDTGIVGIHRCLMICDRIYCELVRENRTEIVEEMLSKEQKKFMKSMKTFPSVLRTEYAYELLGKKNGKEAEKIRRRFEKIALKYPYPADMESERELMDYADTLS